MIMKKLLFSILLIAASVKAQTLEVIKISQFPAVKTLASNQLFIIATPGVNNQALQAAFILDAVWNFSSNTLALSNILYGLTNSVPFQNQGNVTSLRDGFMMSVAGAVSNTNQYWWDFGKTTNGQHVIYASLDGTNDLQFLGVTNGLMWQPLSFNVVARGKNINMFMPTNLPHFNTNGWTLNAPFYVYILTNGNEFRMTSQSNQLGGVPTFSTLWTTFGQ